LQKLLDSDIITVNGNYGKNGNSEKQVKNGIAIFTAFGMEAGMMNLEQIRLRKKLMGYSNAELAKLAGIPQGTINKILSGATKNPRAEAIAAIEKVLNDTTYQYGSASAAPAMVMEAARYEVDKQAARKKGPGDYTIDDYYEIPDEQRVELIDGVFYDMAAPTTVHQLIAGSVHSQIQQYILKNRGKCIPFISPVDVKLDADNKTMVQPDVIIVCNKDQVQERIIVGGPDFVLEVVSKSSRMKDYVKKASKYLEAGVKEYWIADPQEERLTIMDFANDGEVYVGALAGRVGMKLYDNKLEIDFDEYKQMLDMMQ